ncbi:MAG: methyltransferase regulatory domain-containing protein [Chromatiales bacterium]|nr:methyltransferase regulatory domain-containing protein [Chromatiales bacterium]
MHTLDSYDQVPYESLAIPETHPDYLATLARLLGIPAAHPEGCRVLELGAAAGGNLIPMAFHLPASDFVGVELSAEQAQRGQAMIAQLGLANAHLLHQNILDIDASQEPFDYIVVHGVYSWVPEMVKEHILHVCGRLLSEHGIAYVSYNVLPGWRLRGMLRDMLLHHAQGAATPGERLERAHELLDLLAQGLAGDARPGADVLRREAEYLRTARASYLYHEYLEETNAPELFGDFMTRARRHGLQYLADAQLHSMFASTLGGAAESVLSRFDDQVEQEQYMDFLRLRPFRQTLLIRADAPPELDVDLERLHDMALYADLHAERSVRLDRPRAQTWTTAGGGSFEIEHPLTKAVLEQLAVAYPNAMPLRSLLEQAAERVHRAGGRQHAQETASCLGELFNLYASQAIGLTLRDRQWPNAITQRPRASALARAQAACGEGHVATVRHGSLGLDPLSARLLSLLDGNRDREAVIDALLQAIAAEPELAATVGETNDPQRLRQTIATNVERLLDLFARGGLLD